MEAGKTLEDRWAVGEGGCDLLVLGHNGFMRSFTTSAGVKLPTFKTRYDPRKREIDLALENQDGEPIHAEIGNDAYGQNATRSVPLLPGATTKARWMTAESHGWYDFSLKADGLTIRLAGRVEDGKPGFSDLLMHTGGSAPEII